MTRNHSIVPSGTMQTRRI